MIPTFVISLSYEIPERLRSAFLKSTETFSLVHQPGTNGASLPASVYYRLINEYLRTKNRLLTPGEVGCCLSHLAIYGRISSNSPDSYALILEDDVIISPESLSIIEQIIRGSEADLIHFGGMDGLVGREALRGSPTGKFTYRLREDKVRYLCRTVGYAVRADVAKRIYSKFRGSAYPIDDYEYLCTNGLVTSFDFSDLISHPISLSESLIEDERCLNPLPYTPPPSSALQPMIEKLRRRFRSDRSPFIPPHPCKPSSSAPPIGGGILM